MADNFTKAEVRKLRKKLRQIEHLERLERDLTEEEYEKVCKKSDIRGVLKDLLKKREEENKVESLSGIMEKNQIVTATEHESDKQVPGTSVTADVNNTQPRKKESNSETVQHLKNPLPTSVVENIAKPLSSSQGEQSTVVKPGSSPSGNNASTSSMKPSQKQSTSISQWDNRKFTVQCLEGHNDLICSVDMDGSLLLSASRDTMLKLWDCESGTELRSMGGHTGGITSVVLIKKDDSSGSESTADGYLGVTGSNDCSIRLWSIADGTTLRSIYAYSPILCLDHWNGRLVSGSESGKVELWDLDAGENIRSARSDDDSVTCIKFQDERIISASSVGLVKVWDVRQRSLLPALSSDTINSPFVKNRRIHCLAATENEVYWGDDGTNIKVLDIRAGKVRKLKNHLTEFGSTNAMVIQDSLLISSGYDLDRGTGYLNVRSLPNEEYLTTMDDDVTSFISCLCSTNSKKDGAVCQRLCTGGNELKVWDQIAKNKVRKRPRADEDSSLVTCKHLRRYSSGDQIDTESSDESDDERRDESSDDDDENEGATTSNARQSWCTIS